MTNLEVQSPCSQEEGKLMSDFHTKIAFTWPHMVPLERVYNHAGLPPSGTYMS